MVGFHNRAIGVRITADRVIAVLAVAVGHFKVGLAGGGEINAARDLLFPRRSERGADGSRFQHFP